MAMSLAPLVSKDGFHYAGDSLYVEASGHNRHRRATLPELNALFHLTSAAVVLKDNPGHWYEAQLLHYGLPPSKSKAVAKTRLLDALNKGGLAVPTHIQRLEAELKKAWTKKEREAKAALKKTDSTPATKKRKADAGDKGSTEVPGIGAATRAVKKPKPKRERGHAAVGVMENNATLGDSITTAQSRSQGDASPPDHNYRRLGLLNGLYELDGDDLDEWRLPPKHKSTLILALEGDQLWGAYNFDLYFGILKLPRPFRASDDRIEFTWRGRNNYTEEELYDVSNGWIKFLGDGKIEGMIDMFGNRFFEGVRVSDAETRPENSAKSMKQEWENFD